MADENVNAQDNTNAVADTGAEGTPAESGKDTSTENDTLLSGEGQPGAASKDADGAGNDNTPGDDHKADEKSTQKKGDTSQDGESESDSGKAVVDYDSLEVPEGFEVNFDDYKEAFEQAGFTQEQVQAVLQLGAEKAKKDFEADQAAMDKVQDELREAARTDPEFGGEKFEENLGIAKKALDAFGSPELTEYLQLSGAGNHPEVIRAFVKVGKAISEDRLVSPESGHGTGGPKKSREEVMYPNMAGKKE
jgi:hypothetical protein